MDWNHIVCWGRSRMTFGWRRIIEWADRVEESLGKMAEAVHASGWEWQEKELASTKQHWKKYAGERGISNHSLLHFLILELRLSLTARQAGCCSTWYSELVQLQFDSPASSWSTSFSHPSLSSRLSMNSKISEWNAGTWPTSRDPFSDIAAVHLSWWEIELSPKRSSYLASVN